MSKRWQSFSFLVELSLKGIKSNWKSLLALLTKRQDFLKPPYWMLQFLISASGPVPPPILSLLLVCGTPPPSSILSSSLKLAGIVSYAQVLSLSLRISIVFTQLGCWGNSTLNLHEGGRLREIRVEPKPTSNLAKSHNSYPTFSKHKAFKK